MHGDVPLLRAAAANGVGRDSDRYMSLYRDGTVTCAAARAGPSAATGDLSLYSDAFNCFVHCVFSFLVV